MTQITSISDCKTKLPKGLVVLYGALGENAADQVFYLTQNDDLVQKFTGLTYADLAKAMPVDSILGDDVSHEGLDTTVEGFCIVNRKRVAVDLATMPGIAAYVGAVVTGSESVFAPFVDFNDDQGEESEGFDFLNFASQGRCINTGQAVDVTCNDELDNDFSYIAVIDSEVVRLNAFGYTRHGEVRLEPVVKQESYVPLTDQYIAQEGTLHLHKDEAPVFVSKYLESLSGPSQPSASIKLKAYTIHHKDDGVKGIAIDLA